MLLLVVADATPSTGKQIPLISMMFIHYGLITIVSLLTNYDKNDLYFGENWNICQVLELNLNDTL